MTAMAFELSTAATAAPAPVLVVEDDVDVRTMIEHVLRLEGLPVSLAANGAEALAQLREGAQPRVILLDLMMPVMNGLQFLREQALDPQMAPIPVVLMSGDDSARAEAAALGAAGFIRKPVELAELIAAVRRPWGQP
jgi:two-component system, chemotaxis family, chemotaxis protein CheY